MGQAGWTYPASAKKSKENRKAHGKAAKIVLSQSLQFLGKKALGPMGQALNNLLANGTLSNLLGLMWQTHWPLRKTRNCLARHCPDATSRTRFLATAATPHGVAPAATDSMQAPGCTFGRLGAKTQWPDLLYACVSFFVCVRGHCGEYAMGTAEHLRTL